MPQPPRPDAALARRTAAGLAQARGGVLLRREALAAGIPRWLLRAEVAVGRWTRPGRQTLVLHNGPLDDTTRRAVAALEVGPRAALDGVSALQHRGVTTLTDSVVHVIAPKSANPLHPPGVRVHESRRFREEDVGVVDGVRVVSAAVAAVHAALWARTDREASLFPVLVVQQRLASPQELSEAVAAVQRHVRRRLLLRVAEEVQGGVRSLNELDVARAMRARGLPEPTRQSIRTRASGRQYLDCEYDAYDLTLEVDGPQHDEPVQRLADVLRDLEQVREGSTVLRIPSPAWRLDREAVLDGLERVFAARGWRRAA